VVRSHPPLGTQAFQHLPAPSGRSPYRLALDSVLAASEAKRLNDADDVGFHVIGDSGGVTYPVSQQLVADIMGRDFSDPGTAQCPPIIRSGRPTERYISRPP